ncbi:MAG: single-stranded-DNA-specific exonuclease RecJ [Oscillospiraceae bacterium]|nr:single-stranded-DNA-specific exonuclease RecJ [Oscillospiraceae bacterium]
MELKNWIYQNKSLNKDEIDAMSKKYGFNSMISTILLNRGIHTDKEVKAYISKSISHIHHPMGLKDVEKAAEIIKKHIDAKNRITVYGDYDVDGITSTALMYMFLKELDANVDYYIPDRFDEGYGMNIPAINKLIKNGTKLIITVDCGITAVAETSFAKLKQVDVIITDHHTCKEKLPEADAVINPKQPGCEYPFKELAGVGVAFKVILALAVSYNLKASDYFNKYCEIVTVGTIADVVPLLDENRIIVDKGLSMLQNTRFKGIKALIEIAGIADKDITSTSVSFAIAPRINAAGRMGDAKLAVRLLLSEDDNEAYSLAKELNDANIKRQNTEVEIYNEAIDMIASDCDFEKNKVIVLCKKGWHDGVIGIVASKICDLYSRPCILITYDDNFSAKGSGRSIEGFNLFDALAGCGDILSNFGGHAIAAGLSLNPDDTEEFKNRINEYANRVLTAEKMKTNIKIDSEIMPEYVTGKSARVLAKLEPFGVGNPKPVFSMPGLTVVSMSRMGIDEKHIRIKFKHNNMYFQAVGFGMGRYSEFFNVGDTVEIAFTMDMNYFSGTESLQLMLKDMRYS